MRSFSVVALVVSAGLVACGSSSSSPGGGGGARDASPFDGATADGSPLDAADGTAPRDSAPDDGATDACATDAEAACGCKDTAPFAPADPTACDACLRSSCASQLADYESSCWVIQGCSCSCQGFDDTCTNNAQPFYTCGHTTCAAQCAGADAGDASTD